MGKRTSRNKKALLEVCSLPPHYVNIACNIHKHNRIFNQENQEKRCLIKANSGY